MEADAIVYKPSTVNEKIIALRRCGEFNNHSRVVDKNPPYLKKCPKRGWKLRKGKYELALANLKINFDFENGSYGESFFIGEELLAVGLQVYKEAFRMRNTPSGLTQLFFCIEPKYRNKGYSRTLFPEFLHRARQRYFLESTFHFDHPLTQCVWWNEDFKGPRERFKEKFLRMWGSSRSQLGVARLGLSPKIHLNSETAAEIQKSLFCRTDAYTKKSIWKYLLYFCEAVH